MDRVTIASILIFMLMVIPSWYIMKENSHVFVNDGITFVYHEVPIVLQSQTTITTAWVYGKVIIDPPVITVNNTTYTFMKVTFVTRTAYMGNISVSPSIVKIGPVQLHKSIRVGNEFYSFFATVVLSFISIYFAQNMNKKERRKMFVAVYLVILAVTIISTSFIVKITNPYGFMGSKYTIITENTLTSAYIFSGKIPPQFATTIPEAYCGSTSLHLWFNSTYVFIRVPPSCSTFTILSTPVTYHSMLYIMPRYTFAVFLVNTIVYLFVLLLFSTFVEEI